MAATVIDGLVGLNREGRLPTGQEVWVRILHQFTLNFLNSVKSD